MGAGIYGAQPLADVFPKRSLTYPFILSPRRHLIATLPAAAAAASGTLGVEYQLKTRLVLCNPSNPGSRDVQNCVFTHTLPFHVASPASPNPTMVEVIRRMHDVESQQPGQLLDADGHPTLLVRAGLSRRVVAVSDVLDAVVSVAVRNPKRYGARLTGQLIQVKSLN